MSVSDIKKSAETRMGRSIETLKAGLAKIRTGRAHAGILDHVQVEYYGSMVPISQVANVNLLDARTLSVQVWEKNMSSVVEKAIRDSDLGLNPQAMGDNIRVPMPALTEERRRDLTKVVKSEGEDAKNRCSQPSDVKPNDNPQKGWSKTRKSPRMTSVVPKTTSKK